jgi:hypothetical protein
VLEKISRIMGTVFGSVILVLGVAVMTNAVIYRPMFGFLQDLSIGFAGLLVGVLILYASRRAG